MVEPGNIVAGENLLGGAYAVDSVAADADHRIRDPVRQVQLVQGHEHRQIFLPHHGFQDCQQLQLIADVQVAGRLVQDDDFRLLAQGTGKQNSLPLAVTDGLKGPVRQIGAVHQSHGIHDNALVLLAQQAQGPGIGVAAGADHIKAGHELRVHPLGHENGHFLGDLILPQLLHGASLQQHGTGNLGQLPNDGFQDGGLAGAVGANEGHDPAPLNAEAHLPDQGLPVVANGQIFCG